jgi:hypothetical protein
VAALPPPAAAWRPRASGGEAGWSIGQIVGHIGGSRLYFASAYRGEGWIWGGVESDPDDQSTWLPWLRASAERYVSLLKDTPTPVADAADRDDRHARPGALRAGGSS